MRGYDYDLVVIGGGAGGFVASKFARGLGKKVALVEKNKLGGECTLSGCIPSKTLIKVGNIAFQTQQLNKYGLSAKTDISINTDKVMDHVRSIVEKVYSTHQPEVFRDLGIDVLFGHPHFMDNHTIELDGKRLSSNIFIIATGSSPFIPSIDGINTTPYLTNQTFFDLQSLPSSIVVLGGGPIGLELASAMNRLGVKVHVVEMGRSVLLREDRELVDILSQKLIEEGLTLLTKTKATKLSGVPGRVAVTVENENGQKSDLMADSVLIAMGRKANTEDLGLENAGVDYTVRGVLTNNRLQSTTFNIYACGDVAGPYQFSHMAEYQARIAVQNAFLPIRKEVDYRHVIWCTFTDPELAHAGLIEEEARIRHGDNIKIYKHEYKNIDRAKTDVSETGMGKFILDTKGKLIGAHILGSRAGEIIHEVQIAKAFEVPFHKLNSVIHLYPTFSDIVKQPAKLSHIARLRDNPFLKLLKTVMGKG